MSTDRKYPVVASDSCLSQQVADLEIDQVMGKIEGIVMESVKSIMAGEGFSFTIPTRSESNQLYVPGENGQSFGSVQPI